MLYLMNINFEKTTSVEHLIVVRVKCKCWGSNYNINNVIIIGRNICSVYKNTIIFNYCIVNLNYYVVLNFLCVYFLKIKFILKKMRRCVF